MRMVDNVDLKQIWAIIVYIPRLFCPYQLD